MINYIIYIYFACYTTGWNYTSTTLISISSEEVYHDGLRYDQALILRDNAELLFKEVKSNCDLIESNIYYTFNPNSCLR